jgi:hypothetical protein
VTTGFHSPVAEFRFWVEHRNAPAFNVSIQGEGDTLPYQYDIPSFGRMTHSVRTFVKSVGIAGEETRCMAEIYRHGETAVNGFSVRVTPVHDRS